MKTAMIALFALACAAKAFAGDEPVTHPTPDVAPTAVLLGMGVLAVIRSLRR